MHAKVKNNLSALTVAFAMLTVSYAIGKPPAPMLSGLDISSQAMLQADADGALARKRSQGMKRQFAMPFFSFAPLLPKQGG